MAQYATIEIGNYTSLIDASIKEDVQIQLDALVTTAVLLGYKVDITKKRDGYGVASPMIYLFTFVKERTYIELKLGLQGIYIFPQLRKGQVYIGASYYSTSQESIALNRKIDEALSSRVLEMQVEKMRYIF